MKAIVVLGILVVAGGILLLYFTKSSVEEGFDPTQQGRAARAAIKVGASWMEALDAAGEPRKWKEGDSAFDYVTGYVPFDSSTRDAIRERLEKNDLENGFCFLYRFSDAATFAVNLDKDGTVMNIQDKESKADLLGG